MPAYNFDKVFAPMVLDGSKPHTIRRSRRDGREPRPGQRFVAYTGLRTRACAKLYDGEIKRVDRIAISLTPGINAQHIKTIHESDILIAINEQGLLAREVAALIWRDGFRLHNIIHHNLVDFAFWFSLSKEPFIGHLIWWLE